ncbi:hypothetical protein [Streptomyces sp. NPDC127092]
MTTAPQLRFPSLVDDRAEAGSDGRSQGVPTPGPDASKLVVRAAR